MLRYYYFEISWVTIRMFLKAVKGGRLNSQASNTSTELSVILVVSLSLNFLDCRDEMCIHSYKEFLCQYEFQLVCRFLDKIKSLKQSPGGACVLILSLTLCSTCVVLDRIIIWRSNDLCSFRFFLMAFTYTIYTCTGKKNQK